MIPKSSECSEADPGKDSPVLRSGDNEAGIPQATTDWGDFNNEQHSFLL